MDNPLIQIIEKVMDLHLVEHENSSCSFQWNEHTLIQNKELKAHFLGLRNTRSKYHCPEKKKKKAQWDLYWSTNHDHEITSKKSRASDNHQGLVSA